MRSLIQIYALAVCFVTLMCFVVALGIGLYDMVQMAAPNFTLESYQPYQSNDAFVQYFPDKKELPAGEITRLRDEGLRDALRFEQRAALQSGVFVLIIVAIDIVVFAVHWRIARKERSVAERNTAAA
ncbi:MAG: hypothetical protein HYS13_01550 [Planctomycetia bacterium]|nr:hypothetical protein [Planctomycetia bacterium]